MKRMSIMGRLFQVRMWREYAIAGREGMNTEVISFDLALRLEVTGG